MNHVERLREIDPELAALEEATRDGAHESYAPGRASIEDIERVWREFWLPALRSNGSFDIDKLKAELYDAHHLIMEAPKIYRWATGGMCDDPCASAEGIIAMAEKKRADAVKVATDPVYTERNRCVAMIAALAIAQGWNAGIGVHEGEGWDPEWMTVIYIDLPTGQVTWHVHDSEAHLFRGLPRYPHAWDGHSTEQKYARLAAATGLLLKFTNGGAR